MPGEKRLLIIGIDEYQGNTYHSLSNAKRDVQRFSKILEEKYGFILAQPPLFDSGATSDNIIDALIDLSNSGNEEDSLIIYFAGHGLQHGISKKGCWVPFDGNDGQRTFIFNSAVLDHIEAIPAKHILLISDSCYSGTFISRRRGGGIILTPEELEARNSRWIFVSGEETPVSDGVANEGSPFGMSMCEFLEQNVSPVITAGQLFDAVIRMVGAKHKQNPQADFLPCEFHDGGQMVFRLNNIDGEEDKTPVPVLPFELPEPKVEYYIPRQLTYHDHNPVKEFWYFQPDIEKVYLNELVQAEMRLVILGGAGSGKSIELLHLAHRLQAESNSLNPIFKRFNTFTDQNISDYLPVGWAKSDPANLVVILDGLDEVQPQFFQTAIRKLTAFATENPLIRMIISCRNNFYEAPHEHFSGTLSGFSVYHLNDVSPVEIKDYATEYFGIDGQDFINQVYEEGFLDLVQKPFFLNILIKHYSDHLNFATGRSQIMEEALFTYYSNDKEHFNTTIPVLSRNQSLKYLEKIAFVLELLGKNFLTDEELEEMFSSPEELSQAKYLPAFSKSKDQNKWLFEHNNLQEYIASRVLSKQSVDEIIKIIAVRTGSAQRIKPSWVNTLSFFISISDDAIVDELLNWIVIHDIEVIVKFEPDRINESRRFVLFKEIIEFYNNKKIWIYSNNFSEKDLARFCETELALKYLLDNLERSDLATVAKLNCLNILRHFPITQNFGSYIGRIKTQLRNLLDKDSLSGSNIYTVLGSISELKIEDSEFLDYLVDKFGHRRNQYVRTGLYKIFVTAKMVDDYIDIFIDGIDLASLSSPASDRENVNLMSESDYLRLGFEQVSRPSAIKQVLEKLSYSENRREVFLSDYQEVMESLILSSIHAYQIEPSLFNSIYQLLLNESMHHRTTIVTALIRFFHDTDTTWRAVEKIWSSQSDEYSRASVIGMLINDEVVEAFLSSYKADEKSLRKFYDLLVWQQQSNDAIPKLLTRIEQVAMNYGLLLEQPKVPDWKEINAQREQVSFDLMFDDVAMLNQISKIYSLIDNEMLGSSDLFEYNRNLQVSIEERFPNAATAILYRLSRKEKKVSLKEVISWIESNLDYSEFRINRIYADITNKNSINISPEQVDFIRNWSIDIGNDKKILWDFINRFDIQLSEDVLLEFTNHISFNYDFKVSDPGSIEQLEKFVSVKKIKDKVFLNLKNESLRLLEWTNNAAYALRKGMSYSYPVILEKLENTENDEYKFREVLGFWFSKVKNVDRLKKLIVHSRSDDLRWKGIAILENDGRENDFLVALLREIVDNLNQSEDNRKYAANHLMKLNDVYGLEYLAKIIISKDDPSFDFRLSLGNISLLTDIRALDTLMKLLVIGKRPEYKRDHFNDLEERSLAGITAVGAKSTENYLVVKQVLEVFMEQNKDTIPDLNFLHYTIIKIEESLKQKISAVNTIQSALTEYNLL